MEFNSLIRRVAEFSGADAAEIEPDPALKANGARPAAQPGEAPAALRARQGELFAPPAPPPGLHAAKAGAAGPCPAVRRRRRSPKRASPRRRPRRSIARATRRCARSTSCAHGSRAPIDAGVVAIDTETTSLDPMQAELCGFSLAVGANEACYVPLIHRQGGDGTGLFPGEVVPDQMTVGGRARRAQAAARGPRRPQGRAEPEVRLAGAGAPRHRDRVLRRHHADVLRARRRPPAARHGRHG